MQPEVKKAGKEQIKEKARESIRDKLAKGKLDADRDNRERWEREGRIAPTKKHDMESVSYTHLDVYKRQDDTFNFVVAIMYSQLFNLLCDKADDVYNGRLPVLSLIHICGCHVR